MLILLSPSKTLDLTTPIKTTTFSQPKLLKYSKELLKEFKQYSQKDLQKIMKVSANIANTTHQRFQDFSTPFTTKNSRQSLFTFTGEVFKNIDSKNYTESQLTFVQTHLRILSGFYGALKPLDLIQPYRLEMALTTPFWKGKITEYLQKDLKENHHNIIVDLASKEYTKPIQFKNLNAETFTINFKEKKNNEYKTVAIFAKKARGSMVDYIIKNKITDPQETKKFSKDGYKFNKDLSAENQFTFIR